MIKFKSIDKIHRDNLNLILINNFKMIFIINKQTIKVFIYIHIDIQ